jgi:hypothetical protein
MNELLLDFLPSRIVFRKRMTTSVWLRESKSMHILCEFQNPAKVTFFCAKVFQRKNLKAARSPRGRDVMTGVSVAALSFRKRLATGMSCRPSGTPWK